jgi:CRISPR-associated exonuclease Cas4
MVEEQAGELMPVEYKHGRMGRWLNDHVQLCAQGMCLEERTGKSVQRGEVFYWRSRRRVEVPFTPDLRARTEQAVARAFELLEIGQMPPPVERRSKCHDCSLEGICLPREVLLLAKEAV